MRTVIPTRASLIPPQAVRVFQGIIYDVYHWQQPLFDGTTATFEMLKRPDSIKYLPHPEAKSLLASKAGRFLPKVMTNIDSLDELLRLPKYQNTTVKRGKLGEDAEV